MGVVFLIAIGMFIAYTLLDTFDISEYGGNQTYIEQAEDATLLLDGGLLIILIALFIVSIIMVSQLNVHPAFVVVGIFVMIIAILISVAFSNTFEEFAGADAMTNTTSNFPITTTIFANLPMIIFVLSLILLVVLYGRTKEGGF